MQKILNHIVFSSGIILPEIIFIGLLLLLIVWVSFTKKKEIIALNGKFVFASILILLIYGLSILKLSILNSDSVETFGGMLVLDSVSQYFKGLLIIAGILGLLHIWVMDYKFNGEMYILLLFSIVGMAFMTMAKHFLIQYISIEMVSISSYIMVGLGKGKKESEASIKFLIFGATSSAIMLYAISLFYGMTGSLNYADSGFFIELLKSPSWTVQVIVLMYLGGLFFKISAAPFHIWTPDVYEAAPTPIVSFLSIAPKIAAILLINRFIEALNFNYYLILGIIISLSLFIGNLAALWQTNTKRLLSYSSIAHAGFLLIGLLVSNAKDYHALYFFVSAYLALTMTAFLLVDVLSRKVGDYELNSLVGLSKESLSLGLVSLIVMLGLVGLPPTIGFTAKILVLSSVWDAYSVNQMPILLFVLIFGILNSAISIYYYLKIPYYSITKSSNQHRRLKEASFLSLVLLYALTLVLIYLFVNPEFIINYSKFIHF
jgi:NADH-quinone oxidoreductase subunit N